MKKLLSLLLALSLVLTLSLPALAFGNGQICREAGITAADARQLLRMAVGLEPATPENVALGDIDLDGEITAADARLALRIAVELEKTDGKFHENEYDVLRSGFFDATFRTTEGNEEMEMNLVMAGDEIFIRVTISMDDGNDAIHLVLPMLKNKDGIYIIDDELKAYDLVNEETSAIFEKMLNDGNEGSKMKLEDLFTDFMDFSSLPPLEEATSTGPATFHGEKAQAYTFAGKETKTVVYMQGKRMLGMLETPAGGYASETVFSSVTLTVPTAKIRVPADYTPAEEPGEVFLAILFRAMFPGDD